MTETLSRKERVKLHFQRNKHRYIGVLLVAGSAGITYATMKEHITRLPGDGFDSPPTGDSAHVLSGFTNNGIIIADNHGPILFGSHIKKFVKNVDTGETFESVTAAAKSAGVPTSRMSNHLNGRQDHVAGSHYKIIGLHAG